MKKEYAGLVIGLLVIAGIIYYQYSTVNSKNCSDFTSWVEAQKYYESHSNWLSKDQNRLDGNHDGFVCESLFKKEFVVKDASSAYSQFRDSHPELCDHGVFACFQAAEDVGVNIN